MLIGIRVMSTTIKVPDNNFLASGFKIIYQRFNTLSVFTLDLKFNEQCLYASDTLTLILDSNRQNIQIGKVSLSEVQRHLVKACLLHSTANTAISGVHAIMNDSPWYATNWAILSVLYTETRRLRARLTSQMRYERLSLSPLMTCNCSEFFKQDRVLSASQKSTIVCKSNERVKERLSERYRSLWCIRTIQLPAKVLSSHLLIDICTVSFKTQSVY